MPDNSLPSSIADMPVQYAANPGTEAEVRARYFNTGNAFNIQLPNVPNAVFTEEPRLAFSKKTKTGLIPCDTSGEMKCNFPATSPFVLAYYARINANETLTTDFVASGSIYYVIQGEGKTVSGDESISWGSGDIFVLPGGERQIHQASKEMAILWVVTNEPQLAFEHLQSPEKGAAPTEIIHYPASEIKKQIELIYKVGRGDDIAGSALIFSSSMQEETRNVLPTLTLAMNSLPAGGSQRPHRHNSVAVSLVIKGENCFSMIDGERKDWAPWATTITPPVSVHSHHNEGDEQSMFLIVQDGGLYYHARAMGFEFVD